MICEDVNEVEASLNRIKRVCKVLGILLNIAFCAFLAIWAIFVVSYTMELANSRVGTDTFFEDILSLLSVVVMGPLVAALVKIGSNVFLDVVRGESPFTMSQSNRMRRVAIILLIYAVFEAILSPGFVTTLQLGGLDIGYRITESPLEPSIPINAGVLLVAAALWAVSLVFEYGVLLQEFSDETL